MDRNLRRSQEEKKVTVAEEHLKRWAHFPPRFRTRSINAYASNRSASGKS